jgi:hypothetical protein
MRKTMVLGTVLALTLMAGFAFAGTGIGMSVNIPFDFYAGTQLMPAGEYKFEMGPLSGGSESSVIMRTKDGTGVSILLTRPDGKAGSLTNHLRFNQYGRKYFLSGIAITTHKTIVKTNKLEQELRSQMEQTGTTILLAQR